MSESRLELMITQMDESWQGLSRRLTNLSEIEFFWQPVPHCWTVHPVPGGRWIVDYVDSPPDPPPFTTIAWRVLHLAGCKLMYHEYAFGNGKLSWDELPVPTMPSAAIAWLEGCHKRLESGVKALRDTDLDEERLTNWGEMWPTWRIVWTMIFHDIHHGAEIGCLRRLFRGFHETVQGGDT
jgi:hypothetical protein